MRYAIMMMALILSVPAARATPQDTAPRKISCKTPEIAPMCYWARGRLVFASGNPSYRIWKVGTKRILGVYSGPAAFTPRTNEDSENPEFPANVAKVYRPPNNILYADFEICPLEPEQKGEMQSVCVETAKNIFVEWFEPARR